jgi:hypothetical protein
VAYNEIDSSESAFYRIAKAIVEQAYALATQARW